jgi:hypothetical protein
VARLARGRLMEVIAGFWLLVVLFGWLAKKEKKGRKK